MRAAKHAQQRAVKPAQSIEKMKYSTEDGTIVDTDLSPESWEEDTRWDGNNNVSKATGSQWHHEKLYRSSKGRYYVESWSNYQGTTPSAEFVSDEDAAKWLLINDHALPQRLKHLGSAVCE
jgi:hypothetical protein